MKLVFIYKSSIKISVVDSGLKHPPHKCGDDNAKFTRMQPKIIKNQNKWA